MNTKKLQKRGAPDVINWKFKPYFNSQQIFNMTTEEVIKSFYWQNKQVIIRNKYLRDRYNDLKATFSSNQTILQDLKELTRSCHYFNSVN